MANLQLIKSLAEERNIPLSELARRCEISEQQIHLMCRTNSTKISTLEKIAVELNVSPTVFFDESYYSCSNRTAGRDYAEHGDIHHNGNEAAGCSDTVLAERVKSLEALLVEKDALIAAQQTIIDLLQNKK